MFNTRILHIGCPSYSLTHLTRNYAKFIWTKECEATLVGVKFALTHAPILTLPIPGEPFEIICDASLVGVGVLFDAKWQAYFF